MRQFFILAITVVCFSCMNSQPDMVKAASASLQAAMPEPKYYFYPKANVYFDSVNHEYVYLANDGVSWLSEKQIPAAMQTIMDKNVLIESPLQPVWKDNERHKLIYSALLYASPSDTQVVRVAKPIAIAEAPAEVKKERKGLRRFFDKLFGKKKD